jgi:hypothetical protein
MEVIDNPLYQQELDDDDYLFDYWLFYTFFIHIFTYL